MSLTTKSIATVSLGVAMVLTASFVFATPAKADMLSDLQAQVQALLAQIAALQGGTPTTGGTCNTFTQNHQMGDSGGEVKWIQQFLNSHGAQVSATGAGSPGNESDYFGSKTRAAVSKFQADNGISPTAGYWGPITRAKANSMCVPGSGTGTPVPSGPGVTVLAGVQPANSLAPGGAARVPFTTFSLQNNTGAAVTINGITVQRTGLGQDAVFSGIVLVDQNGLQMGTSKTLNSNHQAVVGDMFILAPGETKMLTVAGNMQSAATLATYAGQVVTLSVVGVNTSAPVAGSLPISGAAQTINATLGIGSVSTSTSSFDPGSATQRNVGDTAVRFSGIKFTANSAEDLKLYSIRWRQVGTASGSDVGNLVTIVDGVSYPATMSTDGKYFTTVFPGGILIPKGNSVDAYIQGDVVGTNVASRTVDFDIDRVTDVYFVGQTYGYGVAPSGTYQPWYNGYIATINPGTVTTIGKANEVAAQNIAANVSNQPLGGFVTNFAGEAVSVSGMVLTLSTSSASLGDNLVTSVSIVDQNGAVVAGPVDATWTSAAHSQQTITFTDTVTFPIGRQVYTVKGKVPSSAVNGAQITIATTPSSWTSPTGQTTGNSITIGTGAFSMNQMTVRGATLQIVMGTQPTGQSVVAGTQMLHIATVQLNAGQSGEDVRLASLPLDFDLPTSGAVGDLSGCQIYDGATALNTGSRVVNTLVDGNGASAVVFSFDNTLVVAKGTTKNLEVKCNLSGSVVTGTYRFGLDTAYTLAITGATSGNSLTVAGGQITMTDAQYGGTMTVATGSFAVTVDSSSPSYAVVAGGSSGVTAGVIKLRATNEAINLTKLGLTLTNGASTDVVQATIWDGSTQVGTVWFGVGDTFATSTLTQSVNLPKDQDKLLTVKVDLAGIGTSASGREGRLVKMDPLNAEGTGVASGSTRQVGATAGVAGIRTFRSFPVLAQDSLSSSGVADGRLLRFRVTANSAGPVGLYQLNFTLSTSTITGVTNIGLYAYSDSSYSSPVGSLVNGQFGSTLCASGCTSNGPTLVFQQATPLQVSGTNYFELRGSVAGVTTGSSVVAKLLGDAAYPTTGLIADGENDFVASTTPLVANSHNFIWSGNATSTAPITANDWSNGFGISGLPASGIIQTRSN